VGLWPVGGVALGRASQIWSLRFAFAMLKLNWSELGMERVATTALIKAALYHGLPEVEEGSVGASLLAGRGGEVERSYSGCLPMLRWWSGPAVPPLAYRGGEGRGQSCDFFAALPESRSATEVLLLPLIPLRALSCRGG
jgi:hypothetical protein